VLHGTTLIDIPFCIGSERPFRRIENDDSQQILPLPKIALEAHAFGDLKSRDDTSLDVLAALSSTVRRDFGKRFCGIRKRFLVDVGIAKEGPAPKRRSPVFSFGNLELW
jgi:hypothetical protein